MQDDDLHQTNKSEIILEFVQENTENTQKFVDHFGPWANPYKRYVCEYKEAAKISESLKNLGVTIVLTLGVWDMPHIGHCRYMEEARKRGHFLFVGVETDSAVKIRKGPQRPIVPFTERVEMLCHLRSVGAVVPVADYDPQRGVSGLGIIDAIRPDIVIISKRSMGEEEDTAEWIDRLAQFCGRVEVLPSQAETSTSNKVRDLVIQCYGEFEKLLDDLHSDFMSVICSTKDKFLQMKERLGL